MASIRKSLATLWDTADPEDPPPLRRADAKQGLDLEQVGEEKVYKDLE